MFPVLEQTKQAGYIAGHLLGKAYIACPNLPPVIEWEYEHAFNGMCIPVWTITISNDVYKLIIQSCKCRGNQACTRKSCKCFARKCLSICLCRGKCLKDNPPSDHDGSEDDDDDEEEESEAKVMIRLDNQRHIFISINIRIK